MQYLREKKTLEEKSKDKLFIVETKHKLVSYSLVAKETSLKKQKHAATGKEVFSSTKINIYRLISASPFESNL